MLIVRSLSGTNFFLLHLSLLREYLDLEFASLAPKITFEYNLERIIDDFILMAVFVGNDFLPHLPDLHINEGALDRIWGIYKEILPAAGECGFVPSADFRWISERAWNDFYAETATVAERAR
jgi:5'-3' exonuclease